MPQAGQYLSTLLGVPSPPKSQIESRHLSAAESDALAAVLRADADDMYYSSCVTLLEALLGLRRHCYTWATVKFYYSTFYALRAALALNGDCLFYIKSTPYHIKAAVGAAPSGKSGNTHYAAIALFSALRKGHFLLSQKIGITEPLEWLTERREEANYRKARFGDPAAPDHFRFVETDGVRKLLETYIQDGESGSDTYTFLPDHAVFAYPLRALLLIGREFKKAGGASVEREEVVFMDDLGRDSSGQFPRLMQLLHDGMSAPT